MSEAGRRLACRVGRRRADEVGLDLEPVRPVEDEVVDERVPARLGGTDPDVAHVAPPVAVG